MVKNSFKNQSNQYGLFQYPITAFGIKRRQKNQLEEETRNIEFHQTQQAEATHIKILSPFQDSVERGGMDSLAHSDAEIIFNIENLEQNIWSSEERSPNY